jgi:hypothetical protein
MIQMTPAKNTFNPLLLVILAWAAEAPHSGVAECRDECTRVDDSGSD